MVAEIPAFGRTLGPFSLEWMMKQNVDQGTTPSRNWIPGPRRSCKVGASDAQWIRSAILLFTVIAGGSRTEIGGMAACQESREIMEETRHYPQLFGFRRLVLGDGFVAGVQMSGRGLLVEEGSEGFWMYGVNPGSAAGHGEDRAEAVADFRERLWSVLVDLAGEAEDFDGFRSLAEEFFYAVDEAEEERWEQAVLAVREGRVESDLPRKNSDAFEPEIAIHRLSLSAQGNPEPSVEKPNLAA